MCVLLVVDISCGVYCFFFSSRRRHTRCALVTGVQRVLFRSIAGSPLEQADAAIILLHGRGQPAQTMLDLARQIDLPTIAWVAPQRSDEHTSELQSLMRTSYAVFCLKKQKQNSYYYKRTTSHIT